MPNKVPDFKQGRSKVGGQNVVVLALWYWNFGTGILVLEFWYWRCGKNVLAKNIVAGGCGFGQRVAMVDHDADRETAMPQFANGGTVVRHCSCWLTIPGN